MSNLSRKVVAVGLTLTTAVWFAGSVMPAFAQSQSTIDALMAQIAALQNQIKALQGSTSGASTSSYSFTRDLTVGSKGADVTALQQILINGGYLKISAPTAYFGAMTKTAVAAWQKAAGVSATGYFGPKSRAAIASTAGPVTPGGPVVNVPGSGLVVSVASGNPVSGSVAQGGVNVPILKLYFTAGTSAPVTVTQFTVVRSGLSQDSDLNNVYLYDGGVRLATNLGINQGSINFSNSSGIFTVNAGQTKEITVSADVNSTAAAGHIITLGVAGASAITASGAVSGAFPITSNYMTVATMTNLATLTVSGYSSSTVNINAGQQNYLIGQFTVQAGNNPVKVTNLRFTNVGTVDTGYVQNIKLMNGSTQLGATVGTMPATNVLSFDLASNPLMLTSGQSIQLNIYADVMGGTGRYFQLTIQQASDVQAVDNMYSVGIGATLVSGSTFPVTLAYNSILNGGLVISRNANSPTTYVVAGNTNQVLAKFDILASGDAVKINQLVLAQVGQTVSSTNIRVVDDQGAQLGSTITTGAATMYVPGSTAATNNLNYVIPANVTRTLTVYADLASTISGTEEIDITTGGSAQSYTNYTAVTVGTVSGYSLTVLTSASNLVGATNYSLGTPTISAGTRQAKIASFNLTAGQVNPVSLTGVSIQVVNNSTVAGWTRTLAAALVAALERGTTCALP
ncbi:MAG: peptidoglycan-binding domain-containing protein, partial [Minisyncoccia bacterium]